MNNSKTEITNVKLDEKQNLDASTTSVKTEETKSTETKVDKETNVTSTETKVDKETKSTETKVEKKEEVKLELTHLDEKFVYEVMSIPTVSSSEYRLVTFIVLWARRNGIKYEFDNYGNVYLTKGELSNGEYYPCVTAHLDSVQQKQKPYAQAGFNLQVKTRISTSKKHEIYVDGMGIGGDDKAGVLIGLSMFKHVDKLKAAFFLEEEIGCKGSNNLNTEWFKDVGYVIGYDSPDLNRAAWSCSGTKLFNKAFFDTYMKDVCEEHGLTKFLAEPFTDVKSIREKTNIICMNFGSGYYGAHGPTEYCVIEDMDNACRMGHALINKIGNTLHLLEHKSTSSNVWVKGANGGYVRQDDDEDEKYFRTLSGYTYQGTTGYSGYGGRYSDWGEGYDDYWEGYSARSSAKTTPTTSKTTTPTTQTSSTKPTNAENNSTIDVETLRYITDRYDQFIDNIKNEVKKKCDEIEGVNFEYFASIFENKIKF